MPQTIQLIHETTCAPDAATFWREQVRLLHGEAVKEVYEIVRGSTMITAYTPGRGDRRDVRAIANTAAGVLEPERDAVLKALKQEGWRLKDMRTIATGSPREQEYGRQTIYTLEKR